MNKYHQGDVLLVEVDKLPEDAKKIGKIVQYGEATGHAHKVIESDVYAVDTNGHVKKYVVFPPNVDVDRMEHEEHPATVIKRGNTGILEVRTQQEFFPSKKEGEEGFYKPVID